MNWDIVCKVIDNHGDIGVCWRLAVGLARRGESVRLWADDLSALAWMAPCGHAGVELRRWTPDSVGFAPGDVVIEAFGCELGEAFIAAIAATVRAKGRQPAWINLEYLSAEAFARHSHGLNSPVLYGAGTGLVKQFFYPGFTPGTGGLLREDDLLQRQTDFDRLSWLQGRGLERDHLDGTRLVSLFCYEPTALTTLLDQLARSLQPTRLLVTAGRASAAVKAILGDKDKLQPEWNVRGSLSMTYLPLLSQLDFDHLLWSCDLNFVRGEDSLVRALWAGQPFVWQAYPQSDDAHLPKLKAFLDWLQAPPSLRQLHMAWNGADGELPCVASADWITCVARARARLLLQPDLATQLLQNCTPAGP